MARITLYGRDFRFVALATSICTLSYTLAFLSLCETACSIICSTTSAIRRFSKYFLHFGCIVYHVTTIIINNLHQIKNYFYVVFCGKLLKESLLPSITYPWQEFSARPGKNNPVAGKVI